MMYSVAVKRDFIAQHYLIGGDWGPENQLHSHHYQIELQLQGESLNRFGYLVDIVEIEGILNGLAAQYRDCTLNDLPAFQAEDGAPLNPSIEHFSRILCDAINAQVSAANISILTVKLWENEIAWAAYELKRRG
jgi:6-pyruvoyltetrahydropterin/6-carboxytetrahydropterin synthase